jgi:hypothetical protein
MEGLELYGHLESFDHLQNDTKVSIYQLGPLTETRVLF